MFISCQYRHILNTVSLSCRIPDRTVSTVFLISPMRLRTKPINGAQGELLFCCSTRTLTSWVGMISDVIWAQRGIWKESMRQMYSRTRLCGSSRNTIRADRCFCTWAILLCTPAIQGNSWRLHKKSLTSSDTFLNLTDGLTLVSGS